MHMIEYKCASCGLTLYRVYAERAVRGYYTLYEEFYKNGEYVKHKCYKVLSPATIAGLYKKCPRCGKPLKTPSIVHIKVQ